MKLPTDILRMYKEIHGWVGIISGLALFIAFYAGAITMFEGPLQQWASPPTRLAPAPALEQTPDLLAKVLAAHPEAAASYTVNLVIDPTHPARISWVVAEDAEEAEHGGGTIHYASLTPGGELQVETRGPSPVAQFIDDLHRQVGLPLDHEIAMPIMGVVALLYVVAMVSGLIVLLPSLVKDLFILRTGRNLKRMWLDAHNVVGLFSLPFHIIMALTAVVFAFHDQFYMAQGIAFDKSGGPVRAAMGPAPAQGAAPSALPPLDLLAQIRTQVPEFQPVQLAYAHLPNGRAVVRVSSGDPDYNIRTPLYGLVTADPVTGKVMSVDYMPGRQDGWSASVTSFFALHYGSFGGTPVRWAYFLLGLAGAFLFYSGNLLWVESRRRRERKGGAVEQTRATRILAALTVGVPVGCVAGIAVTVAAARWLGDGATLGMHSLIYHALFLACTAWALWRGAARAGWELPLVACLAMLTIPLAGLTAGGNWDQPPSLMLIDLVGLCLAAMLAMVSQAARRRWRTGPRDSVWGTGVSLSAG
ncbi:PepSY-associated TM helix domain-containing protein [Niveispirillum irakense]|uniref:PepSY-associated TM helix domain-containing protein n=1 Tax=Niveispirillum irakense TaxID=34011 RepID=UPI0003FF4FD8|nr:PepSY-associated TM helix domain-containing protein [Niveispirillum irakense]